MSLQFERGNSASPVGHALIYFQAGDDVLATYVTVPPIQFDLASYMPGFLASAMQGMDLGETMTATPMPPIPEKVDSRAYLETLAERRHDDLISAGVTTPGNPMHLAAETAEIARQYGELYRSTIPAESVSTPAPAYEPSRFAGLDTQDQLTELTKLTGRLVDSVNTGAPDGEVLRELQELANMMPAKYRVPDLIAAAEQPGERGRKLADLYLQRSYKLYREEYLDLERIDREITAIQG